MNYAKIKFNVVIKRARPEKQLEKMSFEDVRNALLVASGDGFLDDEEFLFLYDYYESVNPSYPYWDFDTFCLDSFNSCECEAHFRVAKDDLPILLNALQLLATFKCPQGTVCSGMEGLCLMLKRYFDLISTFAYPIPELCMITNTVLDWIYNMHGFRLTSWKQRFLSPANLQEYANAIARQGSPLSDCCGFIDGTVRPICRPGDNQRIVYNGHKRVHALKFQSVALPNGLRSRRDFRDLAEMTEISPRRTRSRRDGQDLAEMAEISSRSCRDLVTCTGSRRDDRDLGEISLRFPRSRRDDRDLAEKAEISPRLLRSR